MSPRNLARRARALAIATLVLALLLPAASARANHGIQINDVVEVESALEAVFFVTIPASASPTTVFYTMTADTATAGQDYVDAQGTFEIPAGETTAALPVELIDDLNMEADSERFLVHVSTGAPVHDGEGQATLLDDDLVVNSTADPGSGACDVTQCTLREAISFSNGGTRSPRQRIGFRLPGAPSTITPGSPLPRITRPVVIDGTTDPDFDPADPPVVIVNGQSAGGDGFVVDADDTDIRGLVIHRFAGSAVHVGGDRALVQGNYIGTNRLGTIDLGNGTGIALEELASGATIGGPSPAERNLISGNTMAGVFVTAPATGPGAGAHTIQGNWIGLMSTGAADLGNSGPGILLEDNGFNSIGGPGAGEGNVISGNDGGGVLARRNAGNNLIQGNFIGTDADGSFAIANTGDGIRLETSANTIGGTAPGAGNVISGNGGSGVAVSPFSASNSGANVIQGNLIGTHAGGTLPLGNAANGVLLDQVDSNQVGGTTTAAGNRIWFNGGDGIAAFLHNTLRRNSVDSNGLLGIDVGAPGVTPNDPGDASDPTMNHPVLTSAIPTGSGTTVRGVLDSLPSHTFTLEFFSSPTCDPSGYGEGRTFLGQANVTTNSAGVVSFKPNLSTKVPAGHWVTAVAFDPVGPAGVGNTSELSRCVRVPSVGVWSFAFTPPSVTGELGGRVTWHFFGQSPPNPGSVQHTATDSSGMGLFDSGARGPGTSFGRIFTSGGGFPYRCTIHPSMTGTVQVPMTARPSSGGVATAFTVTWATVVAPAGFVYDVEIKRPGSSSFVAWQTGVTSRSASFTPDAGPGAFSFRARLRKPAAAAQSGWSPIASINVT